ncbi:MAG: hypothetical protein F6K21_06820, partial [Symploca sp. SIO2D2]|nr:hypothetical protein [Symploca sp. SIO2D2]
QQEHLQKFLPKQIITADPAPSTEMGIPKIIKPILQLLQIPFVTQALNISKTGASLSDIPVAIMHGADDKIVKPKLWIKPPLFKKTTNFDYIASQHKKIYFSLSNRQNHPPLVAFHNQAVTDTGYFSKDLFKNFGGVKETPNAYNCEYIYSGLRLVVEDDVRADELLPKFPLEKIKVTDKLEIKSNLLKIVIISAIVLALLSLGYWLWHSGIVLNFS